MKIVVVVPTRNRSDIAQTAALSALSESRTPDAEVMVSDNSDDPLQQAALAGWVSASARPRLAYVRPPHPLPMAPHWNWAVDEALRRFAPSHVMVLTDRMVFRAGAVTELAAITRYRPDAALSFLHDRVNDLRDPVVLEPRPWSGAVCSIPSAAVIREAASCSFHQCFPRLLNCIVPVAVLRRVGSAYGSYCGELVPDFGFAFRYLATHSELLYYDKAMLTHYAIARSNGTSEQRGIPSPDSLNFRKLWASNLLTHSPYPEIVTVGNSIIEEYEAVRAAGVADFPQVRMTAYVKMLAMEAMQIEDPVARENILRLLGRRGHRGRTLPRRAAWAFVLKYADLGRAAFRMAFGAARFPRRPLFGTREEALAHNATAHRPQLADARHLRRFDPTVLCAKQGSIGVAATPPITSAS